MYVCSKGTEWMESQKKQPNKEHVRRNNTTDTAFTDYHPTSFDSFPTMSRGLKVYVCVLFQIVLLEEMVDVSTGSVSKVIVIVFPMQQFKFVNL